MKILKKFNIFAQTFTKITKNGNMGFTVWKTGDLSTNERMIAFYKKELWSSHILDKAKKQQYYGTKRYRRFVEYRFPSARRYKRIRAIVSDAYRKNRNKYSTLANLGKKI